MYIFLLQAFHFVLMLIEARNKYYEFCLHITVMPATISNNVYLGQTSVLAPTMQSTKSPMYV